MPGPRGRAPTSSATWQSLERDFRVVGRDDTVERRERAIVEFHHDALQRPQRRGDFEQMQVDGLIGAQHLTGGDAKGERVADLAGGSGDGDVDGLLHRSLQPRHMQQPLKRGADSRASGRANHAAASRHYLVGGAART